MNKIIIPTGYMGSGSSAITDLIQEYRGYETSHGSFEYIFLHCPDGVFDLEDKLLVGNNALRSDEAIHSFERCMRELYTRKFWWPGNYKKNLHPDFWRITQEYLDALIQYRFDDFWYMQQKLSPWRFVKMCVRKMLLALSGGRIEMKLPLAYSQIKLSLVNEEEFYRISRGYLEKIFQCMGLGEKNLILDQLLLPFNLWRMGNYFSDNAECFVVQRDPRDVFISNKYILGKNSVVPYPTDVGEFCEYYRRLRAMEREADNLHIHYFYFEDLLYHYEESTERVQRILGLQREDHVDQYLHLDPRKSIYNTQLFRQSDYREEAEYIEEHLSEFLYQFPYVREVDVTRVF